MKVLVLVVFTMTLSLRTMAQEDKYKALFLYKIMQNLEFPHGKIVDKYRVGVVGNSKVFDYLVNMANNKEIFGNPISIERYTSSSDMSDFCLIFLSHKNKNQFEDLHSEALDHSAVLIGESFGLGKKGAALNFVLKDGKIAFEMNTKTFARSNVKVSASLSELALKVN